MSFSSLPILFVHGNHDNNAINYFVQIAQPQVQGASVSMETMHAQDELFFSLNYGPIHFVVLTDTPYNSDYAGIVEAAEVSFLQTDLAAVNRTQTPWVIALHHKPDFDSSYHPSAGETDIGIVRQYWSPIFVSNGVDVVFSGHNHDFEISKPISSVDSTGQNPTISQVGGPGTTLFVVSGGAGADQYVNNCNPPQGMSPTAPCNPWTAYGLTAYNYVRVHVTQTTLQLMPYQMGGTAIVPPAGTNVTLSLTR